MYRSPCLRTDWVFAMCCCFSPSLASADLVVTNFNAPSYAFTGSVNATHSQSVFNFQFNPISTLPQSNTLSSTYSSASYALTQSHGFSDVSLSANLSAPIIDGTFDNEGMPKSFPAGSAAGLQLEFTPTVNETYSLSQMWNEDQIATVAYAATTLFDVTASTSLYYNSDYRDNFGATTSATTGSDWGTLIAGHIYYLGQVSVIANYPSAATNVATAVSIFDFSAAPPGLNPLAPDFNSALAIVPEPSSFALLGLGGLGLVFSAYRRRGATS